MHPYKRLSLLSALFVLFLFASCNTIEPAEISNGYISLQLWSDWKYKSLAGIDSYEGVFENKNEEISFSLGYFTSGSHIHVPEDLFYEETIIDDVPCQIVKIKSEGNIFLFLFFNKGDGKNHGNLVVTNPDDDQKFINIFQSIHFL